MLWIALAASAQLSAPVPKNLGKWFYADDTPSYLVAKGDGLWFVSVRIGVGPDGALKGCQVEGSSGIAQLDAFTCRKILRRAKFVPATSADGSPAFGVYRTSIRWAVASAPWDISRVRHPDVEVQVQNLPPDVKSPTLVRVMFAVDQSGNIGSCLVEPTKSFEHVDNNPALVPIACDQLAKFYKPVPAKDAGGNAIPSVQDALVRFTTARSEAASAPH
jgi:TonB family protein